jgi:uncharacterized protein YndB with AHSA1/START domain
MDEGSAVWRYERALSFSMTQERAFALFTDPNETRAWLLPFEDKPDGGQETVIEGQAPVSLEVLELSAPAKLVTRMRGGNVPGHIDTIVEVTSSESGANVQARHLGYGDAEAWAIFGSSFSRGWHEAYADLALYVRTGVILPRHIEDRRASIAAWPRRRDWGVEIAEVFAGGFADEVGLECGDILVKLGRAGIYEVADIWTVTRTRSAGEEVQATWIRDGAVMNSAARLSRFEDFGE